MSGGGGGGGGGFQDNSLQVEQAQEQFAREQQARADAQKAQQKQDFQDALAKAVAGATSTGNSYLASRGLSPDQYAPQIAQIIADTKAKVPDLDANPGQYFTSDTFASGMNDYQTAQRANNNSKVTGTFTPGFETSYIPRNSIDSIVNDILTGQTNTAQQQIDFQRKRGLLNDAGYNTAEQKLGDQGQAARSTLTGLATGVLNKDYSDLTSIVGNAGNAANAWSLGNPDFSLDPYKQQVQDTATRDLSNLGGDVKSALGSTQLFDIPSIIAAAGITQGPQNLTTVDTAPGIPFSQKKNNVNRGLGSNGGF